MLLDFQHVPVPVVLSRTCAFQYMTLTPQTSSPSQTCMQLLRKCQMESLGAYILPARPTIVKNKLLEARARTGTRKTEEMREKRRRNGGELPVPQREVQECYLVA